MFLRNVDFYVQVDMELQPRRPTSAQYCIHHRSDIGIFTPLFCVRTSAFVILMFISVFQSSVVTMSFGIQNGP